MTPGDLAYCQKLGIPENHAEYPHCIAYYARMEKAFHTDYAACNDKAAVLVPDYLYDRPHFGETQFFDRFGMMHTATITVEPDYYRNRSLDEERMKTIRPCMQQKGWKGADSWQQGRSDIPDTPSFSR